MTVWGFKSKQTAQNAASATRQRPPAQFQQPYSPIQGRTWICIAPVGGLPNRSGTTPGKGTCEVLWIDDTDTLVKTEGPDGTDMTIEVFNLSDSEIGQGEYFPVLQMGTAHVAISPGGMGDICKALCECGPYAIDNPEECAATCTAAGCVYQETSIQFLNFGETTPTPFQFNMSGPSRMPENPSGCEWLVPVEDTYGTAGGDALVSLNDAGATTITPPAPYELRVFNGGTLPTQCPIGQINVSSTNGGSGTVIFNPGTPEAASVASLMMTAHPQITLTGCRKADLNALLASWGRDGVGRRGVALAAMLGGVLTPEQAVQAARDAMEEFERDS